MLLCHLILSNVLCLWSLFCRLQILVPLALVSALWWVRCSRDLCTYALERGLIVTIVTRACPDLEGRFAFPLWLSLSVVGSASWLVEQRPQIWNELCSDLLCFWSSGTGAHPRGGKPLSVAPLGMFSSESALRVIFHVLCELSCDPVLALILAPPEPWVCWHLTLVSVRCCFHQVTSRDLV